MSDSIERPPAHGAEAVKAGRSLESLLEPVRAEIDRVLEIVPDNRVEARRVILREWQFAPSPEELQAIVRIANEPTLCDGVARDLTRAALTVRIVFDQAFSDLLEADNLDAERIRNVVRVLPDIGRVTEAVSERIAAETALMAPDDGELVRSVGKALVPRSDSLIACDVLGPMLERLADLPDTASLERVFTSLSETEVSALSAQVTSTENTEPAGSRRLRTHALLLIDAMRAAVDEWDTCSSTSETDRDIRVGEGVAAAPAGEEVLDRLERYRIAHRVVSGQLKHRSDSAALEGLKRSTTSLRQTQQNLAAVHRRVVATLGTARPGSIDVAEVLKRDADLNQLLAESAAHDAVADACREKQDEDDLEVEGIKGAARKRPPIAVRPAYDVARERLRIRVLSGIAIVLFIACATVWGLRMKPPVDPLAVPTDEMSDTLILDEAISVGPMMYAVVSHWSWDDMSNEERLSSVRALGLSAANRGYDSLYLVDEKREELARWNKQDGARLKNPPPPGPGDIPL